jgi:cation-transporting ATPase 13A1
MRMIEYSSESVGAESSEAFYLLGFLLVFALSAAGYVLIRGLEDAHRSHYELLLHCVLIVTSVIPPELPMQTALAVNSSIVALMKLQVFCTEPFRIPFAGKIDTCLFDKTGTLTSDELTAVGTVSLDAKADQTTPRRLQPLEQTSLENCLILAGCHSLISIDGKLLGDPVESASLKSIGWQFNAAKAVSTPVAEASRWAKGEAGPHVEIVQRHHFASKLGRMSVVAKVQKTAGQSCEWWSLVKGSPEMVKTLVSDVPDWYDSTHQGLAKDGMRVIALAYKRVDEPGFTAAQAKTKSRQWAEESLTFSGFIAFRCAVRKDTQFIVGDLQASDHRVIMITGDAILTGIHVAAETDIITRDMSRVLVLTKSEDGVAWMSADGSSSVTFDLLRISTLAETHDLCTTGKTLVSQSSQSVLTMQLYRCNKSARCSMRAAT